MNARTSSLLDAAASFASEWRLRTSWFAGVVGFSLMFLLCSDGGCTGRWCPCGPRFQIENSQGPGLPRRGMRLHGPGARVQSYIVLRGIAAFEVFAYNIRNRMRLP